MNQDARQEAIEGMRNMDCRGPAPIADGALQDSALDFDKRSGRVELSKGTRDDSVSTVTGDGVKVSNTNKTSRVSRLL
jgi:hypothetical protein